MNQKQREAIAWMLYAGGGTTDTLDLIDAIEDFHPEVKTEKDRDIIVEICQNIAADIKEKAHAKYKLAFNSPR